MLVESVHISNSAVGSTSRDLSQLELTMAELRKSGSQSRADLVVAYLTQLQLDLAPAWLDSDYKLASSLSRGNTTCWRSAALPQ